MTRRKIGRNGPEVSAIGLGCMGMSEFYGASDEAEALATIDRAIELGVDFFDTADMYGPFKNEELLGRAFAGRRDGIVLATKFGIVRNGGDLDSRGVNGSPAYVRASIEGSLRRLKTDHVDLYYLHRADPATPIEETVGAMARLVEEGKARHIGLSEVSPQTLERACKVHPVAAVQSEYSLWSREPEDGLLAACRRLGVGLVAYSPLGRGFLTGAIASRADLSPGDFRLSNPRFAAGAFERNLELAAIVRALAQKAGCAPAQLALAWVLAQGEDVVAIPGARRRAHLEPNAAAAGLEIPSDILDELGARTAAHGVSGARYTPEGARLLGG